MYGKKLLKSMARVFTSLHQDWHLKNKSLLQYYSQARSSIPRKMPLMNLSFKSMNPLVVMVVVDVRFISVFLHA